MSKEPKQLDWERRASNVLIWARLSTAMQNKLLKESEKLKLEVG